VVPPLDPSRGGSVTPPSADESVRFGRTPAGVGMHWSVDVDARSELEVAASGARTGTPGGDLQILEYASQFRVDVLAIEGQSPTKLRVEFGKNVQRSSGSAARPDISSAVAGHAYVVDEVSPFVRSDPPGTRAVTAEEVERVLDVVPDLGTRPGVEQALPGGPMAIGQARPEIAAAILRLMHPRAWTLQQGSAVLTRADPEEAVFHVTLEATSQKNLRIRVAGDAHIRRRDAWLTAVELDGTFENGDSSSGSFWGPSDKPGSFRYRRVVRE
jgi:hypothetical protein